MTLNYVTLVLDAYDGQGNVVTKGSAAFVPSAQLTDAGVEWIPQAPIPAVFHSAGLPQVKLLATDNAAPQPGGWTWGVTFDGVPGSPAGFSFALPFTGGATQYLSELVPVSGGTAFQAYAPLGADGHLSASVTPRPSLYGATGLRRWRAALGDSMFSQVPLVCVGDSITAGQGGDGNPLLFSNIPDNSQGWVGQLRSLLAMRLGSYAGEGFIFSDDSRVTQGGGVFSNNWPCVPLRHGPRMLHGSGFTLALTIPAGIYSLGVVQANQTQAFNAAGSNLADVSALYAQTGSVTISATSLTTLTNTGRAIETDIACQPGDVITISAPATAQSYIVGFNLKSGQPGVLVHRIGQAGYVSGDLLGGQTSGTLNQAASSSNQTAAARAVYDWAQTSWGGATGLVIVSFGTNDQFNQAGAGSAAQNDVTLPLYTAWMEQFMAQAVADGWCCLVLAEPRNPNAHVGGSTEDQYWAAMKTYALATDHVAFIDTGELWGSNAAASALSLAGNTTVHPTRAGHGDMARMLADALTTPSGITEITAA